MFSNKICFFAVLRLEQSSPTYLFASVSCSSSPCFSWSSSVTFPIWNPMQLNNTCINITVNVLSKFIYYSVNCWKANGWFACEVIKIPTSKLRTLRSCMCFSYVLCCHQPSFYTKFHCFHLLVPEILVK